MYLYTVLAFALVFWQAEDPGIWVLVGENDLVWTLLIVLVQPPLLAIAAYVSARRSARLLIAQPDAPQIAQQFHHRTTLALRLCSLLGFAAMVLLTRWPAWFTFAQVSPLLQIFGDWIVLAPFVVGHVAVWLVTYPLERAMREQSVDWPVEAAERQTERWPLRSYLDFNLRHHILIVAVPMSLILLAADLTRGYGDALKTWSGLVWIPDAILGLVAASVFVISPLLLARIWRTAPLDAGPVRERLEAMCDRIGLRFREILIWHSDGMMINAAVMGVFAPVRYVLLSDALLDTMSPRQIEAVFGHEAGHVRHGHIKYFLVFAIVGWFAVAGAMELLARIAIGPSSPDFLSARTIEGFGLLATVVFWGVGFGWLSRRFERQADLHGARSVITDEANCDLPCSVHHCTGGSSSLKGSGRGRVCATGAAIFSSALDRVALLNGIPHDERSWRHSSIGSRIRFLTSLAGDPGKTARFERLIGRAKIALVTLAVVGASLTVYYWRLVEVPAILRVQTGGP